MNDDNNDDDDNDPLMMWTLELFEQFNSDLTVIHEWDKNRFMNCEWKENWKKIWINPRLKWYEQCK